MDLFTKGQNILANQPFSKLIGASLTKFEEGKAELAIPLKEDHLQQHGFVHGGVISYAVDNTLTFAGGSLFGNAVTSEYKISYLRPGTGEKLIARANAIYAGKTQAVCNCDVFVLQESREVLITTALGTIAKVQDTKS